MPALKLSVRKTLEENATTYFEAAKKARKKLAGAKKAVDRFQVQKKPRIAVVRRKKEWFEQYRFTFADDILIIGGKDASSNETVIKKHTEPTDTVLHTDIPGSPFTVIKGPASDASLEAASQLCAAYSKAWKTGLGTVSVFWVKPEQVSKTPNTGEFLGKGSFVIRGEKHYLKPQVTICLGIMDNRATAGTESLFKAKNISYAILKPGPDKASDIAKKLVKKLGLTLDDWLSVLPAGGAAITGWGTMHKNPEPYKLLEKR